MKKYLPFLSLSLLFSGFAQTTHVVTFKVNTANITVGPNGLYLPEAVCSADSQMLCSSPTLMETAFTKALH
jgi:hypothetical protein